MIDPEFCNHKWKPTSWKHFIDEYRNKYSTLDVVMCFKCMTWKRVSHNPERRING